MLVFWKSECALGDDVIDSGHRLVIEAINRLNEADTAERGESVAAYWLPILQESLTRQFIHESQIMRLSAPLARAEHEGEHRRMLNLLAVLDDCRLRGGEVAGILLLNLVCFLVAHLRASDLDVHGATSRHAA